MLPRPPRTTLPDTLCPDTTLCQSTGLGSSPERIAARGTGRSDILQHAEAREGETMTPEWEGGEAKLRPAGSGETAGFRLVGVSQTAIRDAEGHATRFSAVVHDLDRKSTRLNSSH